MNNPEVQRTTVSETEREFQAESMKTRDVQIVRRADAALHFEVRRHRFAFVREVLVHGKMVVHASDAPTFFKHISIAHRLLNQTLHWFASVIGAGPDHSHKASLGAQSRSAQASEHSPTLTFPLSPPSHRSLLFSSFTSSANLPKEQTGIGLIEALDADYSRRACASPVIDSAAWPRRRKQLAGRNQRARNQVRFAARPHEGRKCPRRASVRVRNRLSGLRGDLR
jgi:hypothetical protein